MKVRILKFLTTFTQLNARSKIFLELVIGLEHKGRPCKMCDSVRQKLGHTNIAIQCSEREAEPFQTFHNFFCNSIQLAFAWSNSKNNFRFPLYQTVYWLKSDGLIFLCSFWDSLVYALERVSCCGHIKNGLLLKLYKPEEKVSIIGKILICRINNYP